MERYRICKRLFLAIMVLELVIVPICGMAASKAPEGAPAKVAILPFNMHTPSQLAYLQDGIRDMLASRLAWQGKVQVLDRSATNQAIQGSKSDISLNEALKAGKVLKADYVLFGSITALGQSISIDAKMAPVSGEGDPVSLFAQTKSLDEVIPKVNQFAQNINQKIFARPAEPGSTASSDADSESASTRNPEYLVPDTLMASSDKISYINPNFVEITSESSLRQPGLWRSQTFQGAFLGMDVGDLDGDGKVELVTVTPNKVNVYRREANGLKIVGVFEGNKVDHYLWVSVVDTNRDGRAKIFVTNLKKRNLSRPGSTETVLGDSGFTEELMSFVLSLGNGKLEKVCENVPYFLNGVEFPGRGKVLIGQMKAPPTEGAFKKDIYEMQLIGRDLRPGATVNVPKRCNVFNFARADINGDRSEETIVIDDSNRLLILNPAGDQIWKGDKLFAASTNTFEAKVEDRRYNSVDLYAIPSTVLTTDLNKDGIPEIVVNRSLDTYMKFMPAATRFFDRSEIVSLSWDQLGLVENWKTREIGGMVTSIRIADLNGDGIPELIVSLVLAKDFLKLGDSKSTIFTYDLNVSSAKTGVGKPQEKEKPAVRGK